MASTEILDLCGVHVRALLTGERSPFVCVKRSTAAEIPVPSHINLSDGRRYSPIFFSFNHICPFHLVVDCHNLLTQGQSRYRTNQWSRSGVAHLQQMSKERRNPQALKTSIALCIASPKYMSIQRRMPEITYLDLWLW